MNYTIKAHPTTYGGVQFRSRLEARWAAFFDLAGWSWEYEPIDLVGWSPDFLVRFPCGHSECGPIHTLLVEVKPYTELAEFDGHPCRGPLYWNPPNGVCGVAAFGLSPTVTDWCMAHGAGGGIETLSNWVEDSEKLWREAGNRTQWRPQPTRTCGAIHPASGKPCSLAAGHQDSHFSSAQDVYWRQDGRPFKGEVVNGVWVARLYVGESCSNCGVKREDAEDHDYCACDRYPRPRLLPPPEGV